MSLTKPGYFNVAFFDEAEARKNFKQTPSHVVAYARLSFDEDGANFCSIINQRDILAQYYAVNLQRDDSTFKFLADDNISGYKFERPGLFELMHMIERGECNVIIAKDLSRLGRHGALIQLFIEQCERVGVRIVAMEDYDSYKQSDELLLGIRAWSNERLVKDTSQKIRKIIDHKQNDGTWLCAVPFGYICRKYQSGIVEIDSAVNETIHLIDSLYLDKDMGCKSIAKHLSLAHIPTPSMRQKEINIELGRRAGGKISTTWSCGQIYKILNDDFYIGVLRTGKYTRSGINGHDVKQDESSHHVFENHHPAIRSIETHERIQQKMSERKSTHFRATKHELNKYRGMIRCGDCGSAMFIINGGKTKQHYVCGKYFRLGNEFCSRHSIKTEVIDGIAIALLSTIKKNCGDLISSIDKELASIKSGAQSIAQMIHSLKKNKESLLTEQSVIETQRIKRLASFPDDEAKINTIYDQMFEEKQKEIAEIDAQLEELENTGLNYDRSSRDLERAMDIIDAIIESRQITRADVEVLFKQITVYADGRVVISLRPNLSFIGPKSKDGTDESNDNNAGKYSVSYANEVQDGSPFQTSFISYSRAASEAISFIRQLQTRHML